MMERQSEFVLRMEACACWEDYRGLEEETISLCLRPGETMLLTMGAEPEKEGIYRILSGQKKLRRGSLEISPRRRVVPPRMPVLQGFSVKDMMILPQLWEVPDRAAAWKRAGAWLRDTVLWEKRTMPAAALGAGESCLLMLTAAFACRPELVVAGDCTGRLTDPEKKLFWQALDQCRRKHPAAVLLLGTEAGEWFQTDRSMSWPEDKDE